MFQKTSARGRLALLTSAVIAVLVTSACSSESGGSDAAAEDANYSVGVLVIAQADLLDQIVNSFETAVTEGVGDAEVTFDVKNANGDQSLISSLSREFAGSDHDAFAVVGTPAVIALASQIRDRPIFALAMGDPVGAKIAKSLEAPGGNVTGSIDYVDPAMLLKDVVAMHPDATTIGTIYEPSNQNMQVWMNDLKKATDAAGLKLTEATIAGSSEVSQSARSLVDRADVVLIGPDATVIAGIEAVSSAMASGEIPLYVVGGDASIAGTLASIGPDYSYLGSSAGENAAKVLLGGDPATTPFTVPDGLQIVINEKTRAALDITVPRDIAERATKP